VRGTYGFEQKTEREAKRKEMSFCEPLKEEMGATKEDSIEVEEETKKDKWWEREQNFIAVDEDKERETAICNKGWCKIEHS
jgi:hypothetical protein